MFPANNRYCRVRHFRRASSPRRLIECGEKKVVGAILISVGLCRKPANVKGQEEIQAIGQKYGIRLMGPNIYGFLLYPRPICGATFCTAYRRQGLCGPCRRNPAAIGMAIIGLFSALGQDGRLGNLSASATSPNIDEDDLLTFFEQDDNTPRYIAQHCEDLKDGQRPFAGSRPSARCRRKKSRSWC